jgi:hypothetical protein
LEKKKRSQKIKRKYLMIFKTLRKVKWSEKRKRWIIFNPGEKRRDLKITWKYFLIFKNLWNKKRF